MHYMFMMTCEAHGKPSRRCDPYLDKAKDSWIMMRQRYCRRVLNLRNGEVVKTGRFLVFLCLSICLQIPLGSSFTPPLQGNQDNKESSAARTFKQEDDAHVVHCSRERSRAAWKVIQEYLMPSVEQERYKISSGCRLHPDNDLYRDQEQHKHHVDINEWRCRYCRKNFYEEKYLDKHFDNRHFDLLNASHGRCLADLCGALHCDLVMDSSPHKTKCNPAAARNKHLCESLADGCFPISNAVSSRLHEFFLRQFCDAHTCSGSPKPFSKGRKKRRSIHYIILSILTLMLLPLFYFFIYMYQRGIKRGSQELKRISLSRRKKKSG
ncbi:uncharacterized protein LOC120193210 [Hibiscus syriacus]|uniref:uncharacterized protein LOC120193210 n=1 Tax=Hibiscus syriacus TaxID=106335 RepID=UPI001920CF11|nr:uncharacterized protein LOC120193210 [Hibiscus syriacus]